MATTAAPKSTTKPRASRAKAKPVEAPAAPQVFNGLPKRQYTLKRPPAHEAFVKQVVEANKGVTAATPVEDRTFLAFPRASKGVASAINKGVYVAMPKGQFIAKNRTIDGKQFVLVTVAFPEDAE